MKFQFINVPVYFPEQAQAELNAFCAGHKIASLEKHFIDNGSGSAWSFCIVWHENQTAYSPKQERIDYHEKLNAADFALFARLRQLRKTIAETNGLPAYAVFTNEQLAKMVTNKVTSISTMGQIGGIGKGKTEKYGTPFLEILREEFKAQEKPIDGELGHEKV